MYKSTDLLLREKNIRPTQIRREILRLLLTADYALSHSDFNMFIGADFDNVTIYRTLNMFEKKGIIHHVLDASRSQRYAICKEQCHKEQTHTDNHFHFTCVQCEHIYCLYETQIEKSNLPEGFNELHASHIVYGTCKTCNSSHSST